MHVLRCFRVHFRKQKSQGILFIENCHIQWRVNSCRAWQNLHDHKKGGQRKHHLFKCSNPVLGSNNSEVLNELTWSLGWEVVTETRWEPCQILVEVVLCTMKKPRTAGKWIEECARAWILRHRCMAGNRTPPKNNWVQVPQGKVIDMAALRGSPLLKSRAIFAILSPSKYGVRSPHSVRRRKKNYWQIRWKKKVT